MTRILSTIGMESSWLFQSYPSARSKWGGAENIGVKYLVLVLWSTDIIEDLKYDNLLEESVRQLLAPRTIVVEDSAVDFSRYHL